VRTCFLSITHEGILGLEARTYARGELGLSITHKLDSDHDAEFDVCHLERPLQMTVLPGGGSWARAR
jgi:hypothetical protein